MKTEILSLRMFEAVVFKHCAKWQKDQVPSFVKEIEYSSTYREKAWRRTEKEWFVLFDQFCERTPEKVK